MKIRVLAASMFLQFCQIASCQQQASPPIPPRQPASPHDIGRVSPWVHIGSPPSKLTDAARAADWKQEIASYQTAFGIIERSWTGEALETPGDLRFKVGQYEDLIRTLTEAGGYGNLVLATSLRRLTLTVLARYSVSYPSQNAIVSEILDNNRVRLLDCPAVGDMLMEEIKLAPPSGKWHLADSREELELIFRSTGSNLQKEFGRMWLSPGGPSHLISERDIGLLVDQLIVVEMTERVLLAGFVEFLKRGGTPADMSSFDRVMRKQGDKFRFPSTGVQMVLADNVQGLIDGTRKWAGKRIPFSSLIGDNTPVVPSGARP